MAYALVDWINAGVMIMLPYNSVCFVLSVSSVLPTVDEHCCSCNILPLPASPTGRGVVGWRCTILPLPAYHREPHKGFPAGRGVVGSVAPFSLTPPLPLGEGWLGSVAPFSLTQPLPLGEGSFGDASAGRAAARPYISIYFQLSTFNFQLTTHRIIFHRSNTGPSRQARR